MRTSLRGVIEIASHEGIVPMPYFDSVGVLTFGVGHTATAGAPDPATLPRGEAQLLKKVFDVFRKDLARFEARVNRAIKVPLAQHEFDALVSFDYNTGGIDRAELTGHLNDGDREGAANGFMGWCKPRSIIPRREKEQRLFREGVYSAHGYANIYQANDRGEVLWSSAQRVNVAALLEQPATFGDSSRPDQRFGWLSAIRAFAGFVGRLVPRKRG